MLQTEKIGGKVLMALKCSSCGAPAGREQTECAFCQAALPKTQGPVIVQVVVDGVRSHIKETVMGLFIVGGVLLGYHLGRESGGRQSSNTPPEASLEVPSAPAAGPVGSDGAEGGPRGTEIEQSVTRGRKSAQFEFHTKWVSGKYTYILGQFVNTGEVTLGQPAVVAIYVGQDGKELGHQNGYSEFHSVPPGGRAPVQILLSDPPQGADIKFEADIRGWLDGRKPAQGLKVDSNPAQKGLGGWKLSGGGTNSGSSPAVFVQVIVVGTNEAGKIVGIGSGYASTQDPIAPGARGRWEIPYLPTSDAPARIEYFVQGWTK